MTGHRPLSDLMKDFTPERRAQVEAKAAALRELSPRSQDDVNQAIEAIKSVRERAGKDTLADLLSAKHEGHKD